MRRDSALDGEHMTRGSPNKTRRNSITAPTSSSGTARTDGLEERVLAFAEQLGRIAGTVQAKTAGWMDGDTLKIEIARVRDGAADLLQQLTADAPPVEENRPTAGTAPRSSRARRAAWSTRPGRNIVRRWRTIPARTVRTVRRRRCARRKQWSRHPVAAGAARVPRAWCSLFM